MSIDGMEFDGSCPFCGSVFVDETFVDQRQEWCSKDMLCQKCDKEFEIYQEYEPWIIRV